LRKGGLGRALSRLLGTAVMAMLVFALASNFLIIAQATISPLSPVKGNSMYPHIKDGDAVLVTPKADKDVQVGEVVVFPDPEELEQSVVHRVVALEEEKGAVYAVTKGDNNPEEDPFAVPLSHITGEVRVVIPKGGIFIDYLRSPAGYLACVITPLLVLALYVLARYYLERSGPRRGWLSLEIISQT